jgi:hypothetical protein
MAWGDSTTRQLDLANLRLYLGRWRLAAPRNMVPICSGCDTLYIQPWAISTASDSQDSSESYDAAISDQVALSSSRGLGQAPGRTIAPLDNTLVQSEHTHTDDLQLRKIYPFAPADTRSLHIHSNRAHRFELVSSIGGGLVLRNWGWDKRRAGKSLLLSPAESDVRRGFLKFRSSTNASFVWVLWRPIWLIGRWRNRFTMNVWTPSK